MTPGRPKLASAYVLNARRATTSRDRCNRHFLVRIRGETRKRRFRLDTLACDPDELGEREEPAAADVENLPASSKARCCRGSSTGRRNWPIVR